MRDKEAREMVMKLMGVLQKKNIINENDVKKIFNSKIVTIDTYK